MSHDDFATEPVPGLPETPPKGELILWQGRPTVMGLACQSLNLHWIGIYFAALAVLRIAFSVDDVGLLAALPLAIPFIAVGLVAGGLILLIAFCQARATLYTITTARVAMRVGAALTLTLNLPFNRIAGADLSTRKDGSGTIAITTAGEVRLSYLMLWPHVRPWHMKHTQPALRCIPDAARVARILADAAETRINQPEVSRVVDTSGAVAAE